MTDKVLEKKIKKSLGGVIGGGFDPIYLIAQRLVKHSNDEGFWLAQEVVLVLHL